MKNKIYENNFTSLIKQTHCLFKIIINNVYQFLYNYIILFN